MQAMAAIKRYKQGDMRILKEESWLKFLTLTRENAVNLERLSSLEDAPKNYVLEYVIRTLGVLSEYDLKEDFRSILEDVLKWSEVAKTGLPHQRRIWIAKGYNLFAHNTGSAQIYMEQSGEVDSTKREIVSTLIATHGLLGQYIRGEVPLESHKPLVMLVDKELISKEDLETLLVVLNSCVVRGVNDSLWTRIRDEACQAISRLCENHFDGDALDFKERLRRLRAVSISNGEDFDEAFTLHLGDEAVKKAIEGLLSHTSLWYVEAALFDFSFEEFIKIFLILAVSLDEKISHLSFERLMSEIYYQHEGKKRINIYKKRIIEKYLSSLSFETILAGGSSQNIHVGHEIQFQKGIPDTAFFNFRFSPASSALIDFCTEAEKSDVLYEKAIVLLFDLFGLRRDAYDRFYQEENYLQTMNQAIDYKKIILDYIQGDRVVDIGPGGGALMDMICDRFPEKRVMGVDISQNVLDALRKKKQLEDRKWDVVFGDALDLSGAFEKGSVDTIIFCSVLHELFSYIEYQGSKFNHDTLRAALKSAFDILAPGGRIIIRDGIMTEPVEQMRIVRFLSEEGMAFLKRYANDFKGREISYRVVGHNEVLMPVNDAMEFLYTYTWGEKSYVHEVQEQFGYLTPSGFGELVDSLLGSDARIVVLKHFLQDGYTLALSHKVAIFDENRKPVSLPDSTCLVVIEKPVV